MKILLPFPFCIPPFLPFSSNSEARIQGFSVSQYVIYKLTCVSLHSLYFPLVKMKKVSSFRSQSIHLCFEFYPFLFFQAPFTILFPLLYYPTIQLPTPPIPLDLYHHCLDTLQSLLKKSLLYS